MKKRKENNYNLANFLSLIRIILSPIIIFLVLKESSMFVIVIIFAIAALTDAADGYVARNFNQKTELGRKLDMFADRVLMISVVLAIILYFNSSKILTGLMLLQILLLLSREVIATPFMLVALFLKKSIFPNARKIAKFTTLMQGISFPMILLDWSISIYFVGITFIVGLISGCLYGYDLFFNKKYK